MTETGGAQCPEKRGAATAENLTRAGLKVSLFERGGHVLATVDDEKAARQKSEHVESVAANGFVDARFRRHGRVGGDARAYKGCVFVCGNIDCLVFGRIH